MSIPSNARDALIDAVLDLVFWREDRERLYIIRGPAVTALKTALDNYVDERIESHKT